MGSPNDWKVRDAVGGFGQLVEHLGEDGPHRRIVIEELFRLLSIRAREVVGRREPEPPPPNPGFGRLSDEDELPPFGPPA